MLKNKTLSTIPMYALLALPILIPLVTYLPAGFTGFELGKVLMFIFTICFITLGSLKKLPSFRISLTFVLMGVWLIWIAISSLVNNSFLYALSGDSYFYFGIVSLSFLILFSLLVDIYVENSSLTLVLWGFTLMGVIESIVSVLGLQPLTRTTLTLGEPNWFGSMLLIPFLAAWVLLLSKKTTSTYKKYLIIAALIIGLGIVATDSRSTLIAIVPSFVLLELVFRKKKSTTLVIGSIVLTLILTILATLAIGLYAGTVYKNISQHDLRGLTGTDSRLWIYQKGLRLVEQKPLTGWGWERIDYAYKTDIPDTRIGLSDLIIPRSHSLVLDLLISGGILNLLLFGSIWFSIFYRFIPLLQKEPELVFILASLIGLFVYGSLNTFSFSHWVILFFFLGVMNKFIRLEKTALKRKR